MGDIQLALPARVLRRGRCICLALLMMYTTTASAQSGALAGRMLDAESSDPIGWVTVLVEDTERGQMTDEQGRFFFADLPAGRHVIQTLHISYHDTRFAVEITAGDTARVDLHIGHQELHLEGVHIEGQRVASPAPLVEPDVVFSGNKLRQNLSQTIAETIDYEPGIAQRTMGPAPARPVLRGLSGDRLLILEDGERTGDLSATSSDHAVAVDPMTTQRIEIVRGPETMLYGSNALGGVINVQRGYVPVERPESSGGTISWQGESVNGGLSLGLERVHPLGGSLALRADGSWRTAGDVSTPRGTLTNTDIQTGNAALGLSTVHAGGYAGGAIGVYQSDYGIPPDPNGGHPDGVTIEMERQHAELRAQWRRDILMGAQTLDVHHTFSRYGHAEYEDSRALGMEFGVLTHNGGAQMRWTPSGARQHTALGFWYEYRNYAAAGLNFTPDAKEYAGALFSFSGWRSGPWQAQSALRADVRRIQPEGVRYSRRVGSIETRSFSGLSGGFSLQYQPHTHIATGAALMRTFRAPGIEELFSEGPHLASYAYEVGNSSLDSERAWGMEVFFEFRRDGDYMNIALFRNQIDGYIFPKNTGQRSWRRADLFLYQTAGLDAIMHGVETSFAWHMTARWKTAGTLSYVQGILPELEDEAMPRLPPLQGRIGLTYEPLEALEWTGSLRWAAAQKRIGPFETPTDGYAVWDLSGQYNVYWRGHLHAFSLSLQNATDAVYRKHLNRIKELFPEPGRSARLLHKVFF
jgi:iron complex outermembrane receptor protein